MFFPAKSFDKEDNNVDEINPETEDFGGIDEDTEHHLVAIL